MQVPSALGNLMRRQGLALAFVARCRPAPPRVRLRRQPRTPQAVNALVESTPPPDPITRPIPRVGVLLGLSLALVAAPAQVGGQAPEVGQPLLVLERPGSVRALSLGGTPAWADRDPDLFLFNPGFLFRARGASLSRVRFAPGSTASSMTAVTPWWGGGVGLGLRTGEAGPVPERTAESALTAGYGRTFAGIGVGASLTGVSLDRAGASDHGLLLDLGLAVAPGPVGLGLAVGGLGRAPEPPGGTRAAGLAPTGLPWLRFGVGTGALGVGPLDLAGNWGITARDGLRAESGGGLEVSWWPVMGRTFTARIGHRSGASDGDAGWSYGAGFLGDAFTLEYVARERADGGWTHGAALRFR